MLKKIFPFYFPLEYLIHSENFSDLQCNYFIIRMNQRIIFLGNCTKCLKKYEIKKAIKEITDYTAFWNILEFNKINHFMEKNRISRLFEWLCVRVLIKIGLPLYLKLNNFNINKLSPENILLSKDRFNKPFINLQKDFDPNSIPYISISHSKKDVFIALSSTPIGIDCELISNHSNNWINKISSKQDSKHFSSKIKEMLNISDDKCNTIIWSLKEATLKIEEDLSLGLISEISIKILDDEIKVKVLKSNQNYHGLISFKDNSILAIVV
jgi:phosphopantetheinyl transferase